MGIKKSRIRLDRDAYKRLCREVYSRDGYKCRVCKLRKPLHAHHLLFRSQGGDDTYYNLLSLCDDCHSAIHSRWVIILPHVEGQPLDATKKLKFVFVSGWKPKTRI